MNRLILRTLRTPAGGGLISKAAHSARFFGWEGSDNAWNDSVLPIRSLRTGRSLHSSGNNLKPEAGVSVSESPGVLLQPNSSKDRRKNSKSGTGKGKNVAGVAPQPEQSLRSAMERYKKEILPMLKGVDANSRLNNIFQNILQIPHRQLNGKLDDNLFETKLEIKLPVSGRFEIVEISGVGSKPNHSTQLAYLNALFYIQERGDISLEDFLPTRDNVKRAQERYREEIIPILKDSKFPFDVDINFSDPEDAFRKLIALPHRARKRVLQKNKSEFNLTITLPQSITETPLEISVASGSMRESIRAAYSNAFIHIHEHPDLAIEDFLPFNKHFNWENYGSLIPKKITQEDRDAKLHVLAVALRYGSLPKFVNTALKNNHFRVTIDWPEMGISVVATRVSAKLAEVVACVVFKARFERYLEEQDTIQKVLINDLAELSPANAEQFVKFVASEQGETIDFVPVREGKFCGCKISIGGEMIGQIRGMHDMPSARIGACLVSAFIIRKRSPEIWDKFMSELRRGHGIILKRINPIYCRFDYGLLNVMRTTVKDMRRLIRLYPPEESISDQIDKENRQYAEPFRRKGMARVEMQTYNEQLMSALEHYRTSIESEQMRNIRRELPINIHQKEVLKLIEDNVVSIVIGATGSGKSTQVPQIILDKMTDEGRGAECNIIVTQPRRIAAVSVAERVASERLEPVGRHIGYQVRFDSRAPRMDGSINFVTTGVLLRALQENIESVFEGISHIILDEVHERSSMIDFLLVLLKRMLEEKKTNPDKVLPKIVLMSATVDTSLFTNYFKQWGCPSISIPGRTFPVEEHYLEDILEELHIKPGQKSGDHSLDKFVNTELGLYSPSETEPISELDFSDHERNGSLVDWNTTGVFSDSGISIDTREDESFVPHALIAQMLVKLLKENKDDGSILVFLPGISDIVKVDNLLKGKKEEFPDLAEPSKCRVYLLHSILLDAQRKVFEKVPQGCRKVILSTNIAETSVTIPELRYVIDCGKEREKRFVQAQRITTLMVDWVSRANVKQRSGRAGRVQNGIYYGMFSKNRLARMHMTATPEILRSDLQQICLETKALGIKDSIENFLGATIQPPSAWAIESAVDSLKHIGALTDDGELTPTGKLLSSIPAAPSLGRMLLLSIAFRCFDPILVVAAMSTSRSIFVSPLDEKDVADRRRQAYGEGKFSDPLCALNAFREWRRIKDLQGMSAAHEYARANYLHSSALSSVCNAAEQIENILVARNIIPKISPKDRFESEYGHPETNSLALNVPLIKSLIFIGNYPNVAVSVSPRSLQTEHDNNAIIHPSSVNFPETVTGDRYKGQIKPEHIVKYGTLYGFGDKVRRDANNLQVSLKDVNRISNLPLLLFSKSAAMEGAETIIDNWMPLSMTPTVNADLVLELRRGLNTILQRTFNEMSQGEVGNAELDDERKAILADVLRAIVYMIEVQEETATK
ncbi:P-loop containing nucleoside triphosphate hydrolase protein [Lipomyces orientalis]|uniref:P-loop containing nucleoside triphosphate hydrolase protein n=1 Tax=Lipomyces orientalis TaxID=1233043 RepID=A0ACC3TUE1_9ASCO